MRKGQSTVVSSVLISGIIISIISLTYIWGRPLIQKTTDKSNIDTAKSDLLTIKDYIIEAASSGNTKRYDINLDNNEILKVTDKISFETITTIPIVSSVDWSPLNSYELPFKRQNNNITTDGTSTISPSCVSFEGTVNNQTATLDLEDGSSKTFYIFLFNRSITHKYDYACISEDIDEISCNNDCGFEGDTITKYGTKFTFLYIDDNGSYVNILGKEVENEGVLGEDEYGILIARSISLGDTQKVFMEVRFRPLIDPVTQDKIRINLTCTESCMATAGKHTLEISKTDEQKRIEEGHTITESIIKVNII